MTEGSKGETDDGGTAVLRLCHSRTLFTILSLTPHVPVPLASRSCVVRPSNMARYLPLDRAVTRKQRVWTAESGQMKAAATLSRTEGSEGDEARMLWELSVNEIAPARVRSVVGSAVTIDNRMI